MRVSYDSSAASIQIKGPVHVWESLDKPGDFALCINPQPLGFGLAQWKYRGDVRDVIELRGLPKPIIVRGTVNGWLMFIHTEPDGAYSFQGGLT